jgi:alpha-D-ribose 1-methylphosphonate 5-triphosphate synthase subunit PhnG
MDEKQINLNGAGHSSRSGSTGRSGEGGPTLASLSAEQRQRQERMSVLANAPVQELLNLWKQLGIDPGCQMLRGPETGLIALRGRMGGGGAPFNFGEATVTRATVKMENGAIGHAVMLGRDTGKAKLAAVIDALATDESMASKINDKIMTPLRTLASQKDSDLASKTQATRVNFFTMVRGED